MRLPSLLRAFYSSTHEKSLFPLNYLSLFCSSSSSRLSLTLPLPSLSTTAATNIISTVFLRCRLSSPRRYYQLNLLIACSPSPSPVRRPPPPITTTTPTTTTTAATTTTTTTITTRSAYSLLCLLLFPSSRGLNKPPSFVWLSVLSCC